MSSPEKVRILYLTNRFAPAGAETFLLNRMRVVDRSRFEPYAGALRAGGDLLSSFERAGVPTLTFGEGKRLDASVFPRLFQFLRRERITILEAHVWWACLVARVVGRAAGVPIIITNEQDMRIGETSHREDVLIAADLTTPLSDACVRITQACARTFETGLAARIHPRLLRVIPNGIDAKLGAEIARSTDRAKKRAELGIPADAFVIGNVGRLAEQKGQKYLLDAFAKIPVPAAHLVIVGWGPEEAQLRDQASSLGISDRVHFAGKRLDVLELLPSFDVFAFPSVHEGQGIAILEAMAAGVPVIATDVDGIPEMVRHERTGLLIPSRDAHAIEAAVMRLRNEPALASRLADGARRMVDDEFSVEAVGRAYEALYDELLVKKGITAPPRSTGGTAFA